MLLVQLVAASTGALSTGGSGPAAPQVDTTTSKVGNGRIAFVTDRDGNFEIYAMIADGSTQTDLTKDPASDADPAWSPLGERIAFTSDRSGSSDIWVMNADGSNPVDLTPGTPLWSDEQPAWSPDGSNIAFASNRGGNFDIWSMNSDGSNPVDLTAGTPLSSDFQPVWSPDGSEIAFTRTAGGDGEVYVMASDGSGQTNLTNDPAGADSEPAWSPDGSQIAFTSARDGNSEIYVMAPDGSGQTDLTNNPARDDTPVFSPELGTRIAFSSDRSGTPDILIFNIDPGTTSTYGLVTVTDSSGRNTSPSWQALPALPPSGSPIQHVVILFQENHAFDNVFGHLCVDDARCDGAVTGQTYEGQTISLPSADDLVPDVKHNFRTHQIDINGGLMNGFSQSYNCDAAHGYACYQAFVPEQIPSLAAFARGFVISDRTFESNPVGSWGGHLDLASSQLDGFNTSSLVREGGSYGKGWGCDSGLDARWFQNALGPGASQAVPDCVPKPDGSGPYRPSPVAWVPTIMDRMEGAGLSWKVYTPLRGENQYGWATCPSFADCIYTDQVNQMVSWRNLLSDVQAGQLPNLSLVIPPAERSQHNLGSMLVGDNFLGNVVENIMHGPQWDSTAIFITYDDCGCFYDHVPPPPGLGIRVPMVIVSPYAIRGFTDHNVASFSSMLSYVEHNFGLAPLSPRDAEAYDYDQSFNYLQDPLSPIHLVQTPIPAWERTYLREHPAEDDFT